MFFSAHSRTVLGFDPFRLESIIVGWNFMVLEAFEGERFGELFSWSFPSTLAFDWIALRRAVEGSNLRFCALCIPSNDAFLVFSSCTSLYPPFGANRFALLRLIRIYSRSFSIFSFIWFILRRNSLTWPGWGIPVSSGEPGPPNVYRMLELGYLESFGEIEGNIKLSCYGVFFCKGFLIASGGNEPYRFWNVLVLPGMKLPWVSAACIGDYYYCNATLFTWIRSAPALSSRA